jgi:predicted amidohydrolase
VKNHPSTLRVACVQMSCDADPNTNLEQADDAVAAAAADGARLVLLPENAAFLGPMAVRRDLAEPLDGPLAGRFAAMAAAHRVWLLVGGFPERSDDPLRPYNTAFLLGPDGAHHAAYRKLHLFSVDLPGVRLDESDGTTPGHVPVAVDVEGIRVGLSICYDLRFPELYRALQAAGSTLLVVPSAFTRPTGAAHWELLLRARAVENQCYVAAPAQCGEHPTTGRASYGHSMAVDPWGEVIACRPEGVGHICFDVDPNRITEVRERLPAVRHRRGFGPVSGA